MKGLLPYILLGICLVLGNIAAFAGFIRSADEIQPEGWVALIALVAAIDIALVWLGTSFYVVIKKTRENLDS